MTMGDVIPVEVVETGENLTGEVGQRGFVGQVRALKRSTVHVFKKNLNILTITIKHVMTLDDVDVIDAMQELDLMKDLAAEIIIVVSVDYLEREVGGGGAVEDLVDGTPGAVSDSDEV